MEGGSHNGSIKEEEEDSIEDKLLLKNNSEKLIGS